jgi:hypothetical protein
LFCGRRCTWKVYHIYCLCTLKCFIKNLIIETVGRVAQSVQWLATGCTVRGTNPSGGEIFCICPRLALGPTQSPVQWVPGVKSGRGVTLTPPPLLVPWSWKSRATPLLPLWAIQPVQSLSACTRVHFTF